MVFFFVLLSCILHVYTANGEGNHSFNSNRDRQAILGGSSGGVKGGLGGKSKTPARSGAVCLKRQNSTGRDRWTSVSSKPAWSGPHSETLSLFY